jgi:DNA-binding protein Fis
MTDGAGRNPLRLKDRLQAICVDMIDHGILFHEAAGQFEMTFLTEVVRRNDGNLLRAAEVLGIHRNTLAKKIARCKTRC